MAGNLVCRCAKVFPIALYIENTVYNSNLTFNMMRAGLRLKVDHESEAFKNDMTPTECK